MSITPVTEICSPERSIPRDNPDIPEGYQFNRHGVFKVSKDEREKLAGPVWVSARTKDEQNGTYGLLIMWIDLKGIHREQAFPADIVHERGNGLALVLANRGLKILPGKERKLIAYLGSFDPKQWISSVSQLGWIDSVDGRLAYVRRDGQVIANDTKQPVIFHPEQHSPTATAIFPRGTLETWNTEVVAHCEGNPYLVFPLCAALAGPLLKFSGLEGGGFHFFGRSSSGKTTAAQVAASVFGCGADPSDAPGLSLVQRWNTTDNALEALMATHNDAILILDELHTCDSKDFSRVVYNMFGGKGKARLNKNSELQPQRMWRTLVLSTGEISIRQKTQESGKAIYAGQLVRFTDIPTHEQIIENTHGRTAGEFAYLLKQACGHHFGVAGPAFIEGLVKKYENTHTLSHIVRERIATKAALLTPSHVEPEQRRVIKRFSLIAVAGEMAAESGVLLLSVDEINMAIRTILRVWLSESANFTDRIRSMISVQDFLHRHGDSRFRDVSLENSRGTVKDLSGYRKRTPTEDLFLFTREGFLEACGGHDSREVARELKRLGFLFTNDDRLMSKHTIDGRDRIRLYAVKGAFLEHDFSSHDSSREEPDGTAGTSGTA